MSIQFKGRVAIVTGAGGGLGRAYALELARRGAKVVVNDLGGAVDGSGGSSEAARKVVEEITAGGGEAIADGASITDDTGVANLIAHTLKSYGRIDILINNAGILRDKSFVKLELSDVAAVLDVHLMGTIKMTKACWPLMKEQQYGRIVVTTSPTGLYGNFGQSAYGAAKSGVLGLMHTLRIEGAKDNIRINSVCPNAATRMTETIFTPEQMDALRPEHVAVGVICLVDEDAPSGAILVAGGGVFSLAQIMQSQPVVLPGESVTAEDVRANWDRISDFTGARPMSDALATVMECVTLATSGR